MKEKPELSLRPDFQIADSIRVSFAFAIPAPGRSIYTLTEKSGGIQNFLKHLRIFYATNIHRTWARLIAEFQAACLRMATGNIHSCAQMSVTHTSRLINGIALLRFKRALRNFYYSYKQSLIPTLFLV
ncbi:hypothetical protein L0152_07290 [bacterium]|nr:hypothetical protein [bacterium]